MKISLENTCNWEAEIPFSDSLFEASFEKAFTTKTQVLPPQPPSTHHPHHPSMDTMMYHPPLFPSHMPMGPPPSAMGPPPSQMFVGPVGGPRSHMPMSQSDYSLYGRSHQTHHVEYGPSMVDYDYKQDYKQGPQVQQASTSHGGPFFGEFTEFSTATSGPTVVGQQPVQFTASAGPTYVPPRPPLDSEGILQGKLLLKLPLLMPPIPGSTVYPEEHFIKVNAKQRDRILIRRIYRSKLPIVVRKDYLHESRHKHAKRRARGNGGRFLNTKTKAAEEPKSEDESRTSSEEQTSVTDVD